MPLFKVELHAGESPQRPECGRAVAVDGHVKSGAGYGELPGDRIEEVAAAVVELLPQMFDRRHKARCLDALRAAVDAEG